MKLRFAGLICVAILWLGVTAANAQSFRKLTVDDFQGAPDPAAGNVIAYTHCSIDYNYVAKKERNYYMLSFNIKLTVNNNRSWMDKKRVTSREMLAEILKHEQGHYNIAYLEQQELLREVSKTVFYGDYQSVAKSIFDRIAAKYHQLNLDYDADTQHMVDRQQQHSWDMFFKKRLGSEYLAEN
jgi:hypothetical protein